MMAAWQTSRVAFAALAIALYLWLVFGIVWRQRRRARTAATAAANLHTSVVGAHSWLVVHASQTGNAEALAWQTARALHTAGLAARIVNIRGVDAVTLQDNERALFIASTYGEGDPPDSGTLFARRVMSGSPSLSQLHYGLLALGDREYVNYCGFGRSLDAWLQARGASPLFARVEANNSDVAALAQWRHHLSHLAGTDDLPDWQAPAFEPWQLVARLQLNVGSAGAPLFHLELQPSEGRGLPHWESGDLAQIAAPADADHPREYSIASIPADGRLHLLVRQERHDDGSLGLCSGWLTTELQIGEPLPLRVRAHENFRLGGNAQRPLLLIGNGTGIAGLRSHIKARAAAIGAPQWLLLGERNAAFDASYSDELANWCSSGVLTRLDRVYSRDQPERRYVQHQLLDAAGAVRDWIARDAAIYVCGSLEGMASGVEAALNAILGAAQVEQLTSQGRYRRDVY